MRYFLDTEFHEDGRTIELISIAIVDEDGREFYAASLEADLSKCNPWVKKHVIPQLPDPGDLTLCYPALRRKGSHIRHEQHDPI